jgi:hypothetical protein
MGRDDASPPGKVRAATEFAKITPALFFGKTTQQ